MARQARTLAVMFADISESTSLYQKLGDAAARNIVNACLAVINGVLPRYDGRLVKAIGDEAMCVFPGADLALLAACEMQSLVASTKPGNYPVAIHIGLHYGPVLVEENDVFGDTVNVAAYLRAVATAEQILTTEATEQCLSAALKSCVRPVFHAVLTAPSSRWRAERRCTCCGGSCCWTAPARSASDAAAASGRPRSSHSRATGGRCIESEGVSGER